MLANAELKPVALKARLVMSGQQTSVSQIANILAYNITVFMVREVSYSKSFSVDTSNEFP